MTLRVFLLRGVNDTRSFLLRGVNMTLGVFLLRGVNMTLRVFWLRGVNNTRIFLRNSLFLLDYAVSFRTWIFFKNSIISAISELMVNDQIMKKNIGQRSHDTLPLNKAPFELA